MFSNIRNFNESKEDLVYASEHNSSFFVVTRKIDYDHKGKIRIVGYKGYDLKECNNHHPESNYFINLSCEAVYNKEYDYLRNLFISDFTADYNRRDCGYGSVMIKQLIEYAKKLDIEFISGGLSFVDIGTGENRTKEQIKNRERLYRFYPKHGFIIDESEKIRLQLKEYGVKGR